MNKAITILQDLLGYEEEAKAKIEIHEALAELQATQAKLESLKEYFSEIIQDKINQRKEATSSVCKDCFMLEQSIYENILTKLEELEG